MARLLVEAGMGKDAKGRRGLTALMLLSSGLGLGFRDASNFFGIL